MWQPVFDILERDSFAIQNALEFFQRLESQQTVHILDFLNTLSSPILIQENEQMKTYETKSFIKFIRIIDALR
jgi:hypothetical protein